MHLIPDMLRSATQNIANIGQTLEESNIAAATPTTSIAPAGEDEVSQAITTLLNDYGEAFQQLATQAQNFHQQFVQTLQNSLVAYLQTDTQAATLLQDLQTLQSSGQSYEASPEAQLYREQPWVQLLDQAINHIPPGGFFNYYRNVLVNDLQNYLGAL